MRWAVVPAPKKPGLVPTISPKHAEDTNHTVPKYKSSMVTINLGKVTRNTPYFSLGGTFWYIKDWVNPAKNSFLIQLIWHSTLFFRSNYIFLNCFSLHLFINSPCAVLTHHAQKGSFMYAWKNGDRKYRKSYKVKFSKSTILNLDER